MADQSKAGAAGIVAPKDETMPNKSDAEQAIRKIVGKVFDPGVQAYLEKKHIGGVSGKKGTRYEDLVATAKMAQLVSAYLRKPAGKWPVIEEQAYAFVDDVITREAKKTRYYQCKDVESLSWGAGTHPIEEDFRKQLQLCDACNEPNPSVRLVVSKKSLARGLKKGLPASLQKRAKVEHFPASPTVNQLIFKNKALRKWLRSLARKAHAPQDDLEVAFKALLSAWIHLDGASNLYDLVTVARKQSPQVIRAFPVKKVSAPPRFVQALAGIPDLTYDLDRGFFSWNYAKKGMSGILPEDCDSEEFKRFVERVVKTPPTTFEDFWAQLP